MVLLSSLITPDPGLLIWTTLAFLILLFILSKFAWKPLAAALDKRTNAIDTALKEAEKARVEMANLQSDNERLLKEAQTERALILKEAKEAKDQIISEAKEQAKTETAKEVEKAKQEIQSQKMAAIVEVKDQVGLSAVTLAQQLLARELDSDKSHTEYIKQQVEKFKLN